MSANVGQNKRLAVQMEALAKQLAATAKTLRANPDSPIFHQDSAKVIESAEELVRDMKQPLARLLDDAAVMTQFGALRLFIKWKIFEKIPSEGSVSYKELADGLKADTALIARLGACLVANKILNEVQPGRVAHTALSTGFIPPKSPLSALACLSFDFHFKAVVELPAYFDTFGLGEPSSKYNTAVAFAMGDASMSIWDHLNRDPEFMSIFMVAMAAIASVMPTVGDYKFDWVVSKASDAPSRPLVVDVGGSKGHALQAIHDATPGLDMSRCVVEDLKPVVEEAKAIATGALRDAQFVSLDFHTEQPVKGALVYYIRRCLHDYGDDDCVDILQRISEAMESDSRLLIVEMVMRTPASVLSVTNDIIMATLGGKERDLDGFKTILGRAGLEVAEMLRTEGTDFAIIECRKV
ncbi:hypothetical protein QQS21_009796 [Conoideocrella luteorostrata]|uniref:O-methyltransferase C-terminal domain-containing protein n=1 Tax=Conoideocrella luteorostrata TaxID=1105319 RepID=A0AAJ0CKR0_9HYPO|nr:hypothetical protein QQS21_009796 [Conoideocrella luteorostrata]